MTATITCAGCQHAYAETALFCPNCGRPKVREALADPLLGKVLGERFLVQELLGQGGSGTIYRAEHVTLRRKVAIKVLHNELSRDDLAVERFRREATTVAEIDNEHIVEIHDFGRTPDGRLYLAMELLEGETLDGVLAREGQLSVERSADILIQVGEALMEAHAIGYVHRDLRPRNIYLSVRRGKANFVKLLDFGLAKLVETEGQAASTSLGMTFGDPRYMSPEQARGDRIDRRADIYQLGCVAYEMLTGAPPFSGSRVFDILTKQVTEAPQPLPTKRPGVPLWMEAAVTKMLAKDADNRFATTTRMVEALRRGLESGEVMEDEVARRRESIPPPSVSRVMQRMGIPLPGEAPRAAVPEAAEAVASPQAAAPTSAPVATQAAATSAPVAATNVSPSAPGAASIAASVAASGAAPGAASVAASGAAPGAASAAASGAPAGAPAPAVPTSPVPARPVPGDPAVTMRAPVAPPPGKPDSVELLRKRTGTPRVGVPISPAAALPVQQPVAGVIEPARPSTPDDSSARGKKPVAAQELAISQVWYDEGDRLSGDKASDDDAPRARTERARKVITPSTTDLTYYDEKPRRRTGAIAVAGVFAVIGGVMAFALIGGGSSKTTAPPAPAPVAVTLPEPAPSTIVATEPAPTTPAPTGPTTKATPSRTAADRSGDRTPDRTGDVPARAAIPRSPAPARTTPAPSRAPAPAAAKTTPETSYPVLGAADPVRRPPSLATPSTPAAPEPGKAAGSTLTDTPKDPYAPSDEPPSDGVAPEKKAEFFANLGGQQLIGGDTAGAASSFKKALELDGKNIAATIGMGEIALRQGLFGDAIAHLSKATKLAPKSAKAFTLLGEAYLASGNNAQAAAQFKKALQLDPDNARARDGYNEASSRVPPPDDESP